MYSKLINIKYFAASISCPDGETGCNGSTNLPGSTPTNGTISTVLELALGVIGIVAVIYIIIAGLQLVTSGGNPEAAKKARETIIYATIGLVVCVIAEFIVGTFLSNL